MALGTPTHKAAGQNAADNATTSAFTPTASAQLFAFVTGRASTTLSTPIINDPGGLTWNLIVGESYDIATGIRIRMRAFQATAPSSPSSMTISGTIGGSNRCAIDVLEITGAAATVTNFAVGSDDLNGDPAITLPSAPAASSAAISVFTAAAGLNVPPPTGFTELSDNITDAVMVLETAYDNTSPPTSWAYATTISNPTIAIGFEVEVAVAISGASFDAMGWIG